MVAFCPGSHSFYGDVGQVKVAARRDCTTKESDRLKQLAQQVTVDTGTGGIGQWNNKWGTLCGDGVVAVHNIRGGNKKCVQNFGQRMSKE
jgi:hypothetical protein